MTTGVIVCGAAGRMGREIIRLLPEYKTLSLKAAIEAPQHPLLGQDAGTVAGGQPNGVSITDDLDRFLSGNVVVIDFSSPAASLRHLRAAVAHQAPIVIGTTGFAPAEQQVIEELAPRTRCLISSNMSIGVALLSKLAEIAARLLGDGFDIEIVEMHHRYKVDAPSGTALSLASAISKAKGLAPTALCFGREGRVGPRPQEQIGVLALRGGDVVGDHTVIFAGHAERIELVHRAQSRECFARGALSAALWLPTQPVGRYSVRDMLGL
ncbi:4-hydroxy-tetrahydrodipicolinate reductase [bacterium HR30]|nr:4-hydroxy-tetrahydrodipicolinate reductase [bacterium HR30]